MKRILFVILSAALSLAMLISPLALIGENYVLFSSSQTTEIPINSHYAGDANGDEVVNLKDVVTTLKYITGDVSSSSRDSIDVNSDGSVNIADALLIIVHILDGTDDLGMIVE